MKLGLFRGVMDVPVPVVGGLVRRGVGGLGQAPQQHAAPCPMAVASARQQLETRRLRLVSIQMAPRYQ